MRIRSDYLFFIGLFLIPFENLFFAPSSGWAAIAPIAFFAYCIFNIKHMGLIFNKYYILFAILGIIILISSFNYIVYAPKISAVIDSIRSIVLGVSFLFSLYIYINIKGNSIDLLMKCLVISYTFSLLYGVIKVIGLQFNINFILSLMEAIEKRYYSKLAYSFTEPSYISMHIFGIILFFIIFFKQSKYTKNMKILFGCFIIFSFAFGKSVRFIIDFLIVLLIYFVSYIFLNRKHLYKFFLIGIVLIIISLTLVSVLVLSSFNLNSFLNNMETDNDAILRLVGIFNNGIYNDGSFALRFFKISTCIFGSLSDRFHFMTGFGLGNLNYPFQLGFYSALEKYNFPYTDGLFLWKEQLNTQIGCLPVRLLNEFGLVIAILIIVGLYKRKYLFFYLTTMWLYIQFDSYAFYTLWLYIYIISNPHTCEYNINNIVVSNKKLLLKILSKGNVNDENRTNNLT